MELNGDMIKYDPDMKVDPDQFHPVFPRRARERLDALKEEHTIEEIPNINPDIPSEVKLS